MGPATECGVCWVRCDAGVSCAVMFVSLLAVSTISCCAECVGRIGEGRRNGHRDTEQKKDHEKCLVIFFCRS